MLSFPFLLLAAGGLVSLGIHNLPSDLGAVQVCFGIYVAIDAIKAVSQ